MNRIQFRSLEDQKDQQENKSWWAPDKAHTLSIYPTQLSSNAVKYDCGLEDLQSNYEVS